MYLPLVLLLLFRLDVHQVVEAFCTVQPSPGRRRGVDEVHAPSKLTSRTTKPARGAGSRSAATIRGVLASLVLHVHACMCVWSKPACMSE